jgi:hypothetical protein
MMDLLNWTYFAKRTRSNPTYYALHKGYEVDGVSRLVDKWFEGNEWRDEVREKADGEKKEGKGKGKQRDEEAAAESAPSAEVSAQDVGDADGNMERGV